MTDNDIIRVLADEGHEDQSTYYRYNKQSDSWTYIGAVGDYYTKSQIDTRLDNLTLLRISQSDYDNLQNKDANTLYVITGA